MCARSVPAPFFPAKEVRLSARCFPAQGSAALLRPLTLRTIAVAVRTSGTPGTARAPRTEFVLRQLAVAVLVELLEGLAGLGDFVGVEDAVVVEVEGLKDGRHAAPSAGSAGSARATIRTARSAGTTGGTSAGPAGTGRVAVLGEGRGGGESEAQGEEEELGCFHGCCLFVDDAQPAFGVVWVVWGLGRAVGLAGRRGPAADSVQSLNFHALSLCEATFGEDEACGIVASCFLKVEWGRVGGCRGVWGPNSPASGAELLAGWRGPPAENTVEQLNRIDQ